MYFLLVGVLMFAAPLMSIALEYAVLHTSNDLVYLIGKWFVFWCVGLRLLLAGLRQSFNPSFTAKSIFEIDDASVSPIVQELGFHNLALGVLGVATLFNAAWIPAGALAGGLFYGLAGVKHIFGHAKNAERITAMVSDLWAFVVLAGYLGGVYLTIV